MKLNWQSYKSTSLSVALLPALVMAACGGSAGSPGTGKEIDLSGSTGKAEALSQVCLTEQEPTAVVRIHPPAHSGCTPLALSLGLDYSHKLYGKTKPLVEEGNEGDIDIVEGDFGPDKRARGEELDGLTLVSGRFTVLGFIPVWRKAAHLDLSYEVEMCDPETNAPLTDPLVMHLELAAWDKEVVGGCVDLGPSWSTVEPEPSEQVVDIPASDDE